MPWKPNKKLVQQGFPDLKYLPRGRAEWDCTLAAMAYGVRRELGEGYPDLGAWAVRHGVPASERYRQLGSDAVVLWHGTSRERAEKIAEHGLFHKRGLWTALAPSIAHGYCRWRSDRYATEGAMVCILLDRRELTEGLHFDVEGKSGIYRFHGALPPDVVEYVLLDDEVRFTRDARASQPGPWPTARLKRQSGQWIPMQKTPVRYSDSHTYSSLGDFARLCVSRLLEELAEITALEVFSTLYATVRPTDALTHDDVLAAIEGVCGPGRPRRKCRAFRASPSSEAVARAV